MGNQDSLREEQWLGRQQAVKFELLLRPVHSALELLFELHLKLLEEERVWVVEQAVEAQP